VPRIVLRDLHADQHPKILFCWISVKSSSRRASIYLLPSGSRTSRPTKRWRTPMKSPILRSFLFTALSLTAAPSLPRCAASTPSRSFDPASKRFMQGSIMQRRFAKSARRTASVSRRSNNKISAADILNARSLLPSQSQKWFPSAPGVRPIAKARRRDPRPCRPPPGALGTPHRPSAAPTFIAPKRLTDLAHPFFPAHRAAHIDVVGRASPLGEGRAFLY